MKQALLVFGFFLFLNSHAFAAVQGFSADCGSALSGKPVKVSFRSTTPSTTNCGMTFYFPDRAEWQNFQNNVTPLDKTFSGYTDGSGIIWFGVNNVCAPFTISGVQSKSV